MAKKPTKKTKAKKAKPQKEGEITAEERKSLDAEIKSAEETLPPAEESAADQPADVSPAQSDDAPQDNAPGEQPEREPGDMVRVVKERVYHTYTRNEFDVINAQIVSLLEERAEPLSRRAEAKVDLKKIDEEVDELLKQKHTGGEERVMECDVVCHFSRGVKQVYHPETNALIREEPLTQEDRQGELFEAPPPAEPAPEGEAAQTGDTPAPEGTPDDQPQADPDANASPEQTADGTQPDGTGDADEGDGADDIPPEERA
jgi:hypothetical protein